VGKGPHERQICSRRRQTPAYKENVRSLLTREGERSHSQGIEVFQGLASPSLLFKRPVTRSFLFEQVFVSYNESNMPGDKKTNIHIAKIFHEIAELLELEGVKFKPAAYRKAARALEEMAEDIADVYEREGIKGIQKMKGIGKSTAEKIEEYIKKDAIRYQKELQDKTAIRQIIAHFFKSKGISLEELKENARKKAIVYSRYTAPAKKLLELAGSTQKAKEAIDKVATWANSRKLDYAIETIFKKWLELDRLKPKEIVKKPFYDGHPMVWSDTKQRWFVVRGGGDWLEFAGDEKDIEWRVIK